METKETNPKDAIGVRKAPTHFIPNRVMYELGLAMLEGALKYGGHNYRVAGVRASIYYDACRRHLDAFWEGEDIDPDSGLPHIVKAAACLAVLRDSQHMDNWVDDRPPQLPGGLGTKALNEMAGAIIDKYLAEHPEPVQPFTEEGLRDAKEFKELQDEERTNETISSVSHGSVLLRNRGDRPS